MDPSLEKYAGKGQKLYEEWMDYKPKISRPPSTLSKNSLSSNKKTKFFFSNDYATESQINSTRSSTKVKSDEWFKKHKKADSHEKSSDKQAITILSVCDV
ncbi:unnamed protein product [Auanema sp. JU1783]|nr:unnamed protein product [Auanema sp. JU1783]